MTTPSRDDPADAFVVVMVVVFLTMCAVMNFPCATSTTRSVSDSCRTTIFRGEHHFSVTVTCKLKHPPDDDDDG
jgi:hypothetical protein